MIKKIKTSARVKVNTKPNVHTVTKRDTTWSVAIVGICLLAGVVLWSGMINSDLTRQLRFMEGECLSRGGTCSQAFASEGRQVDLDQRSTCEGNLNVCRRDLAEVREGLTTSSLSYVLDAGTLLVREWNDQSIYQDIRLVQTDINESAASSVQRFIGRFEIGEGPSKRNAFSIRRASNGVYVFNATADYNETADNIEAGPATLGFVHPETLNFLTLTSSGISRETMTVRSQATLEGVITAHVSSDSCTTSSQAVVDRLEWNGEVLYQFNRPPTITCYFSETLGGRALNPFLKMEEQSVARDLRSFVLTMQTGQKLRIQLNGAKKPTVTVVR